MISNEKGRRRVKLDRNSVWTEFLSNISCVQTNVPIFAAQTKVPVPVSRYNCNVH